MVEIDPDFMTYFECTGERKNVAVSRIHCALNNTLQGLLAQINLVLKIKSVNLSLLHD